MPSQAVEVVELLARRATLLRLLRERPRLKRELAEELSVSRSTVDRAVRNLEATDYVARGGDRLAHTRGPTRSRRLRAVHRGH